MFTNRQRLLQVQMSQVEPAKVFDPIEIEPITIESASLGLYADSLGIASSTLTCQTLGVLLAAREMERYVAAFRQAPLKSPDLCKRYPSIIENSHDKDGSDFEVLSMPSVGDTPSNDFEVQVARGISDLPFLLHSDRFNPIYGDDLLLNLVKGKLHRVGWQQSIDNDGSLNDARQTGGGASDISKLQRTIRGTVLLDCSSSMSHRDQRNTVAKGAALAFLRRVSLCEGELQVAPFRTDVLDFHCGSEAEALAKLTKVVLELDNHDTTNIQRSLDSVQEKISSDPNLSNGDHIILITDGLSELTTPPRSDIKLHTILIGDTTSDDDPKARAAALNQFLKLRSWSTSFVHFRECIKIPALRSDDIPWINDCLKEISAKLAGHETSEY
ncbi:MAG: VWA domain-containing protein, partial [Bdellovibrionales bacterium]|nr:VWA domain-containing protein [Bdellovibrionales bacterium]